VSKTQYENMQKFSKSDKEIEIMKKSGQICANALKKVLEDIKPGTKLLNLDRIASKELERQGASSSFKTVEDYKYTICTTVNEQVVHGIPNDRVLEEGDIIGIDIGALYKNYHSDLAITVPVGETSEDTEIFLNVGKTTLYEAINKAKVGNTIGDISETIQNRIEGSGYSIVKNLTGHGVGRELHEEPMVPGFGKKGTGPKLVENMTIAIEIIYTKGSGEVVLGKDNWTISSKDKSIGGLFEQTIAINKNGPIVLTPYF